MERNREEEIEAYIKGDNGRESEDLLEAVEHNAPASIPAGILGAPYYFYRKCYTRGSLILLMDITLIIVLTAIYGMVASLLIRGDMGSSVTVIRESLLTMPMEFRFMLSTLTIGTIVINSLLFYGAYRRNIEEARKVSKGNLEMLKELGGVDKILPVISLLMEVIIALMVIATVIHFG